MRCSKRQYFYIRTPKKRSKMTLIIGLKFKDGVIMVADRKVTDTSTGKQSHELKLKVPLNIPLVFGAAGFSHKFKQFNRKILERVDERLREIRLANVSYCNQLGLPFKEIETKKVKPKKLNTKDIEKEEEKHVKEKDDSVPKEVYVYSIERFIEDCQSLIRQLCTGIDDIIRPDLDVLLTLYSKEGARLHHINYLGVAIK
jgi:hypothetical protein